jgi:hypothetical protein
MSEDIFDVDDTHCIDMDSADFKNAALWTVYRDWKSFDQNSRKRWLHGDYKDAPYVLVWRLYDRLSAIGRQP